MYEKSFFGEYKSGVTNLCNKIDKINSLRRTTVKLINFSRPTRKEIQMFIPACCLQRPRHDKKPKSPMCVQELCSYQSLLLQNQSSPQLLETPMKKQWKWVYHKQNQASRNPKLHLTLPCHLTWVYQSYRNNTNQPVSKGKVWDQ